MKTTGSHECNLMAERTGAILLFVICTSDVK